MLRPLFCLPTINLKNNNPKNDLNLHINLIQSNGPLFINQIVNWVSAQMGGPIWMSQKPILPCGCHYNTHVALQILKFIKINLV
jgi:hypothetical protein